MRLIHNITEEKVQGVCYHQGITLKKGMHMEEVGAIGRVGMKMLMMIMGMGMINNNKNNRGSIMEMNMDRRRVNMRLLLDKDSMEAGMRGSRSGSEFV
jgi:hypothetical protein